MSTEKLESDVTSLGGSSTSSSTSPKRDPTYNYYVQSPSRDSHDDVDIKSSTNSQTTPTHSSPNDSPSHPSQSRPSSSSASRVSGPYRPLAVGGKHHHHSFKKRKGWPPLFSVIDEENEDYEDDYYRDKEFMRRCRIMLILMGFVMSFTVICFITWGASRPYKLQVQMKSWKVNNFYYGEGSDYTGVPTKFLTVNCTVKMNIENPATFFGIHVSSTSLNLFYSQIVVGSGQFVNYYQPKKSQRTMSVNVEGRKVPLYGAGIRLAVSNNNNIVPLKLEFEIRSHANLVGWLVKTKHRRQVFCIMEIDSENNKFIDFKRESCSYR
ncbi:hypothetical protein L1887_38212 [Cichorium endivia]|nr:hypothetical protein L1887_38212 [Cichorium endivia]